MIGTRFVIAAVMFVALSACSSVVPPTRDTAVVQPIPAPGPAAVPAPSAPTTFTYTGELTQGGWLRGQAPAGTVSARLGEQALTLDPQGRFFAAFDRDAGPDARLVARLADGRVVESPLRIMPRAWQIENINAARTPGGASAAFMERRRPELARIAAARAKDHDVAGWAQQFVWPVKGRISGRFGSQRVYRGEPGAYHSGIDIATGESGTPFVAPADGVVILAADRLSRSRATC